MSTINVQNVKKSQKEDIYLKNDLVVIGAGACGVAVVAPLIERVKQGKKLRCITLTEKSKRIGPRLAYSDACVGTILNQQANISGIYADDPERFARWMGTHFPNLKNIPFPHGIFMGSIYPLSWMVWQRMQRNLE